MVTFKLPELTPSTASISRQFCSVGDPLSQVSFSRSSPSKTLVKSPGLHISAHGNRLNFIQETLPPGRFWFDWQHLHLRAAWVCAGSLGDPATRDLKAQSFFSDLHFKVKKRVP